METIYTIKEASPLLKMHRNTITRKIEEGKIKANKIGNKWVITESEIKKVRGV
jgi:excisionase family DNA binding protein|tara:strand:- start:677 stop:835 length:159 start_codon:yes stop_codon:yes gene_type:complete